MESVNTEPKGDRRSNGSDDSDAALIPPAGSRETVTEASRWTKYFTVGILCFINLINYMDRFTLAGVLEDIQIFFGIGDDMGGLIQTVFVISYMIFAPLFGYMGDRYSRNKIMFVGILLWSLTTLLGSFMNNFGAFVFFRALVGIGEASYSTIAPTVISDLFVKDARSKMLALFYFAIPVGSGLGYIVGSGTAKLFGSWHWALRVTPVLGVVAAILLIMFVKDPQRGEAEGGSEVRPSSYKDDIRHLLKNRSFMFSTAGFTCVAFVAGALAWWGPNYIYLGLKLQATDAPISRSTVSYKFGIVSMAAGLLGVPLGSMVAQKLRPKYPDCDPLICGFGLLASTPLVYLVMVVASSHAKWCYTFVFFGEIFLNLTWSLVADMLLYVVIPTRRSTAEAFQILVSHALGDAGSPYLIGVISEAVKAFLIPSGAGPEVSLNDNTTVTYEQDWVKFKSLQYALFVTCFVEILGGVFFFITAAYIVRDKERAQKEIDESSVEQPRYLNAAEPNQIL